VSRDRRLAGVGQAELLNAGADRFRRRGAGSNAREEAVEHQLLDLFALQFVPHLAADQFGAAAGDGDGPGGAILVAEQPLLGDAAGLHQHLEAVGVEPAAFGPGRVSTRRARARSMLSPTEQQVIATAVRSKIGPSFTAISEVGGAAADVEHQPPSARRQPVRMIRQHE